MSFRVVVLLTVLCPLAVYVGFVFAKENIPVCELESRPLWITCDPQVFPVNCDLEEWMYTTQSELVKDVSWHEEGRHKFYIVPCSETDDPDDCYTIQVIVRSGAVCTGRNNEVYNNNFATYPLDAGGSASIQDGNADCYHRYKCVWRDSDDTTNYTISGYLWHEFTVGQAPSGFTRFAREQLSHKQSRC